MLRHTLAAAALATLIATPLFAAGVEKAPPPAPYKKVSELVKLPDFLPGMGTLYVDPKTRPAGPFEVRTPPQCQVGPSPLSAGAPYLPGCLANT